MSNKAIGLLNKRLFTKICFVSFTLKNNQDIFYIIFDSGKLN